MSSSATDKNSATCLYGMLLFPAEANVVLALLVSNLPSQKRIIASFSSLNDLPANKTNLGTGPVSGYRTFSSTGAILHRLPLMGF